MNILFLTTVHSSLSQRLHIELTERGHRVRVQLAVSEEAMRTALDDQRPDLVIAPMRKKAIPEDIWRMCPCFIVHPGIVGDRGASSLDWAIVRGDQQWGVTQLQAEAEVDAGAVWASHEFPMRARCFSTSSLYRHEVTEAAVRGTLEAVTRFEAGNWQPEPLDYARSTVRGRWRPHNPREMKPDAARDGCCAPPRGALPHGPPSSSGEMCR